jgi:hypothetical protein
MRASTFATRQFRSLVMAAALGFAVGSAAIVATADVKFDIVKLADRVDGAQQASVDASGNVAVRSADAPGRQAVQADGHPSLADGQDLNSALILTVPAGKRLVIEFVSGIVNMPASQHLRSLSVLTFVNGQLGTHDIVPKYSAPETGLFPDQRVTFTSDGPFYADAGTQVIAALQRNETAGEAHSRFSLSGYYIDVP